MAHCTTYGILARDGRSVAVLRRGPTRSVLLLRWWLGSDEIEQGQWLRAQVAGERADLSPDGTHLIYFAGDWRPSREYRTYTVISRVPFFTALALWPMGDTWYGGGLFATRRHVLLHHRHDKMKMAPGFALPKGWRIEQAALHYSARRPLSCYGCVIERARLIREGWLAADGITQRDVHGSLVAIDPPLTYSRLQPGGTTWLHWLTHGLSAANTPSHPHSLRLANSNGRPLRQIDGADWGDFAPGGDLLFGHGGCLYRLPETRVQTFAREPLEDARFIADLRPLSFRRREPTREAMRW